MLTLSTWNQTSCLSPKRMSSSSDSRTEQGGQRQSVGELGGQPPRGGRGKSAVELTFYLVLAHVDHRGGRSRRRSEEEDHRAQRLEVGV